MPFTIGAMGRLSTTVVLVLLLGCASTREHERREQEAQAAIAQRQAEEARQRAIWEAYHQQNCMPPTEATRDWCAAADRERSRLAQQQQWDRENAFHAQQIRLQQEEADFRERQARRRAIQEAFSPKPSSTTHCTSRALGNTVYTDCD